MAHQDVSIRAVDVLNLVDPATGSVQPVGQTGFTLVASEEFTGSSVTVVDAGLGYVKFRTDGPSWATWFPNWPRFNAQSPGGNHTNTNEVAYFATSKVSLDGVSSLVLACDQQTTVAGLSYTAGMIQSLPFLTQQYGYFEAKIKVATQGAAGHWPAFWMSNSTFDQWPPEIDIWEYFASGTSYQNNTWQANQTLDTHSASATQTTSQVYGCKWTPSAVTFYLNGTLTNTSSVALSGSQYVLINNGSQGSSFSSNDITVDYVRIWS